MKAEIKITHKDLATTLEVDGVDISSQIRAVEVVFKAKAAPVVTMHYECNSVEIDGRFEVQHVCPFGDDSGEE